MAAFIDAKPEGVWLRRLRSAPGLTRIVNRRGQATYRVVDDGVGRDLGPALDEARAAQRRKSRLQSAKLLDMNGRFVCECLICDRSPNGVRLRLMSAIPVPERVSMFDDATGNTRLAAIVWRKGELLGARLLPCRGPALKRSTRAALGSRFYAVRD